MMRKRFVTAGGAIALVAAVGLTGCSSSDPLGDKTAAGDSTVVVGSQSYPSNEIIAEIYAQAVEHAGFDVKRQFSIGQRDASVPALESGAVTLFPEYTGNLLEYFSPDTTATLSDEVYAELKDALPDSLRVLKASEASDQDSYNVTREFSEKYSVTSLDDLAGLDVPIVLGGAPELEERPYGPSGLKSLYGVDVSFEATGETTVDALVSGVVTLANVYTADPLIETKNLVTLDDPKGLFLSSNVVPVVSAEWAERLAPVIDPISDALTSSELVRMNVDNTANKRSAAAIATEWLTANGFLD